MDVRSDIRCIGGNKEWCIGCDSATVKKMDRVNGDLKESLEYNVA
jgi:hypothetical protein